MTQILILMGVSGSGKTTIGRTLAQRLDWPFFDGDAFHPAENVAKMEQGVPLSDADREPWLAALHDLIAGRLASKQPAVVACSALKSAYRKQLGRGNEGAVFVYLRGDFDLIQARLQARQGHYFQAGLLQSQFDDLEEPAGDEALVIDISVDVETIVDGIIDALREFLISHQAEQMEEFIRRDVE